MTKIRAESARKYRTFGQCLHILFPEYEIIIQKQGN